MSEYRPNLVKFPATFYVISDDENYRRDDDPLPYREVLEIVRASDDDEESDLQWEDLCEAVRDNQSPLSLLLLTANSHGHAAGLARREFFDGQAVDAARRAVRDAWNNL
ncbi:hypothetical protein ACH427_04450 [Streptomyces sp. NPDC020379]|uniref:hypothetical protein n=1 Tax=Streptomyces sp. NPDC020379 TaxID=3365071 RepID=UPI00378C5388